MLQGLPAQRAKHFDHLVFYLTSLQTVQRIQQMVIQTTENKQDMHVKLSEYTAMHLVKLFYYFIGVM